MSGQQLAEMDPSPQPKSIFDAWYFRNLSVSIDTLCLQVEGEEVPAGRLLSQHLGGSLSYVRLVQPLERQGQPLSCRWLSVRAKELPLTCRGSKQHLRWPREL